MQVIISRHFETSYGFNYHFLLSYMAELKNEYRLRDYTPGFYRIIFIYFKLDPNITLLVGVRVWNFWF